MKVVFGRQRARQEATFSISGGEVRDSHLMRGREIMMKTCGTLIPRCGFAILPSLRENL